MTFKCQPIRINEPSTIAFQSKLKDLYKADLLPIKYDLYGSLLTKKNVTDEHIICKCFGGTSDLSNITLATKKNNNARGNRPITDYITREKLDKFLAQIEGLEIAGFDVGGYVKGIRQTFEKLWSKNNELKIS